MCDTDSFGSRLSGNGSAGIVGEFKHIKEEIENDEDYFRLLANQTRTMRHFDGKAASAESRAREHISARKAFQTRKCFFAPLARPLNSFPTLAIDSPTTSALLPPGEGLSARIYGFSMAVERKSFSIFSYFLRPSPFLSLSLSFGVSADATEWVICVLPNCRRWKGIIFMGLSLFISFNKVSGGGRSGEKSELQRLDIRCRLYFHVALRLPSSWLCRAKSQTSSIKHEPPVNNLSESRSTPKTDGAHMNGKEAENFVFL
jgi:hypothetical protein